MKTTALRARSRRLLSIVTLAMAISLALAATAVAGKVLSGNKASAVTNAVAESDCNADPDCTRYGSDNCRRQAIRRVSCVAVTVGDESRDGIDDYVCERLVVVRLIQDNNSVKYIAGNSVCDAL